jgi:hypothetical protein
VTPAEVQGQLLRAIREGGFRVEVVLDFTWIFVRAPGHSARDFEDAPARDRMLGKWIVESAVDRLVTDAIRLLPFVDAGTVKMFKLTNVWNFPQRPPEIVAYCVDRDPAVEAALTSLGWRSRWKYNHETHAEHRAT